jgi:hypothetical protein
MAKSKVTKDDISKLFSDVSNFSLPPGDSYYSDVAAPIVAATQGAAPQGLTAPQGSATQGLTAPEMPEKPQRQGGLGRAVRSIGEGLLAFTTRTPLSEIQQKRQQGELKLMSDREKATMDSIVAGAKQLKQIGDPNKKMEFLQQRRSQLIQQGLPTQDTDYMMELYATGRYGEAERLTDQAISMGRDQIQRRIVNTTELGGGALQLTYSDGSTEVVTPSPEQQELINAAQKKQLDYERKLREERAAGTVGGKAKGELTNLEIMQKVKSALKQAELSGKDVAETTIDYGKQIANMPNLTFMIKQLLDLAPIATSTISGKVWNGLVKQFGFSTKGGTARAGYESIVNNELLPQLKAVFGGSPTDEEYNRLVATVGDVDATTDEKKIALKSFLTARATKIQASQRELGAQVMPLQDIIPAELMDALGIQPDEISAPTPTPTTQGGKLEGITTEQLMQMRQQMTGGQ